MNLLSENIIKSNEFVNFINAIENLNNISYKEFRTIIIEFGTNILKDFLKRMNLLDDEEYEKMTFEIGDLPKDIGGSFSRNKQKVTISGEVILDIYNGDLKKIAIIFHELNHLRVIALMDKDVYDINIYRILKENLIASAGIDYEDVYKNKYDFSFCNYYHINYDIYSEELYVELSALIDMFIIFSKYKISLPSFDVKYLKASLKSLEEKWEDYTRNFTYSFCFNNYYMSLDDAFDECFSFHEEWLEDIPLFNIEYYKDKNGKIVKRNLEDLKSLMDSESDEMKKKFIHDLIIERTKGIKENEESYIILDNDNKSNKL